MNRPPVPRGDLRDYLYEQVAMFFIQYSRVVAPSQTPKAETQIIQGYYAEVGEIAKLASDDDTATPRELLLLKQLASCCHAYCAGIAPKTGNAETELAAASRTVTAPPTKSENAQAWDTFVQAAVSTAPVKTLR
eukprot:COSAG01_NODE_42745_length_437_cov_0.502959_1_plen_133_part_10